jgi:hypothetical protein
MHEYESVGQDGTDKEVVDKYDKECGEYEEQEPSLKEGGGNPQISPPWKGLRKGR